MAFCKAYWGARLCPKDQQSLGLPRSGAATLGKSCSWLLSSWKPGNHGKNHRKSLGTAVSNGHLGCG